MTATLSTVSGRHWQESWDSVTYSDLHCLDKAKVQYRDFLISANRTIEKTTLIGD